MANVDVTNKEVKAQVSPEAPKGTPSKVRVNEVSFQADEVILDPSADNAVQVPEHDYAETPLHAFADAKTPEEKFGTDAAPEATGVVEGKVVTASDAE